MTGKIGCIAAVVMLVAAPTCADTDRTWAERLDDAFAIGELEVERVRVEHGFPCCGYLLSSKTGRLGYISDCHDVPGPEIERLSGVDVMVLNCLREREHPTHLSLARALAILDRIGPKRAFVIHMCHDLSHRQWQEKLAGTCVEPAYDGLELEV